LADVRLAARVFAPHYAAPLPVTLSRAAPLRAGPDAGSPVLATLEAGAPFDLLERSGGRLWGVAPGANRVGYLDEGVL
jgi:hypothetical protein